jgi:hypothetical protein
MTIEESFEMFWCIWPRKCDKKNAFKSFKKIAPDKELLDTILEAIRKQRKQESWIKNKGQYIPYPATWLNGERWNDEVILPEVKKTTHDIIYEETRARLKREREEYKRQMEA